MKVHYLLITVGLIVLFGCGVVGYERYPRTGQGIASWYGTDFHGKPTSSGETYDMYALTCAHREFPFGAKLKVTNLSNDKSVVCTVNDRGPFVAGRDIDLSYAAAREIDLIGPGTAPVNVEYTGRDTSYIKEVRYLADTGPFTIQVGSFKEWTNAKRLKLALEIKYEGVSISEAGIRGSTFYRVRIGRFTTKTEGYALAKILADEGYPVFITRYDENI